MTKADLPLAQRREVAIPPFFRRAARVLTLKARWTPASSSTARLSRKGCWLARRCLACVLVPLFLFLGTRSSTFIFMTSGIPPAMSCLIHLINCAPATHFSASATRFSGGGGLASWLNTGLCKSRQWQGALRVCLSLHSDAPRRSEALPRGSLSVVLAPQRDSYWTQKSRPRWPWLLHR